ncbi:Holliday junction resolvase [Campylobacter fetus subsp. fetus]|nr:Holliday junction resolvase [Campylobacter fetus subsp. venerealis]OCS17556.1 Holliday junction resolvase [Campylobacter fetus subsp. fetus]OCS19391.1 crossover junction endodeoxyribonuclease RuvA [Campylobacter fetus subsp. fetus BT 10/98]OCS20611.1 crossover junction endodeoxyribonuclease RuvA [Campylobacter fetus subsp. venerealis cfvi03/596]OCS22867.1 crossover junction endodeoxyribonuclease RuvA [Campylobacter fetus subsp. venerealis cfvi97/532]OCS24426.1 crossover junction endodeoxyri
MLIVAIDVGLKRIGVAVAVLPTVVLPSEPILRKNRNQAAKDTLKMLKEKNATKLVVGLPKGGSCEDEMERRIKHFISLVGFDSEIIYVDEAYSSCEASELSKDSKDGRFDSIAAMVILKRYLNIL